MITPRASVAAKAVAAATFVLVATSNAAFVSAIGTQSRLRTRTPRPPSLAEVHAADAPNPDDAGPFEWHGVTYKNEKAFIDSGRRCGTHVRPDVVEGAERYATANAAKLAVDGGVIDVYFHILHNGAQGNVSDAVVEAQIDVLNAAYADTGWSFNLVAIDRTDNLAWFLADIGSMAEAELKAALREGSAEDLNIYSVDPGTGLLGWATFPFQYAGDPQNDGVCILFSTMPGVRPNGYYTLGDTAVHEVGHWMGLYHTFQGGCSSPNDFVGDTPAERSPSNGCPGGRDSCIYRPGLDPIRNYMNYTVDSCMNEFTAGQDARMDAQWTLYREGN
jgi:hypothetical protein